GFIGDSIVANGSFLLNTIQQNLGLSEVINYGVGGTAYSERHPNWVENAISNRYTEMDDTLDIVCAMAGTNDYNTSVPLGSFENKTDKETFYGALHTTFSGLVEKFPTKDIYIF